MRPLFFVLMLVPAALVAQETITCESLREQHANSNVARVSTFEDWVRTNWPSGRFHKCIGEPPPTIPVPPAPRFQPVLTIGEKRYCYTIALTHAHMRSSPAKTADRDAWHRMRCRWFLGRELPTRPLALEERARYEAALRRLP